MDNEQLKIDLFLAYYNARKNKRNTINQLKFEINFEQGLFALYDEIVGRSYKPLPSICFITDYPVKREVFAAHFRDRIVHHLLYNYVNPVMECSFIRDCYSCRKEKGTLYGVQRLKTFIESCSENYTKDCYVLKLDIRGYFMNIDKHILHEQIQRLLSKEKILQVYDGKPQPDWEMVHYLLETIIFDDVRNNCIIRGERSDWDGLPPSKSMFHSRDNCGLPIGNLTSQLFSNVYLHDFDCFVRDTLGVAYYGRYVDDFVLVHNDKDFLLKAKNIINDYLLTTCRLELHPNKIYLQHCSKGVKFLGAYIKPNREYVSTRTKKNFHRCLDYWDKQFADNPPQKEMLIKFRANVNSYLGTLNHFRSYNIRRKALLLKSRLFMRYGYLTNALKMYKIRKKYLAFRKPPLFLEQPDGMPANATACVDDNQRLAINTTTACVNSKQRLAIDTTTACVEGKQRLAINTTTACDRHDNGLCFRPQ
jgi:hypothetical protein